MLPDASGSSRGQFAGGIVGIAVFGLVLRLLYLFHLRDRLVDGDGNYYHLVASMVATGKGFVYPSPGRVHFVKSAVHPPLWTLTLAMFDRLGMHSWLSQQVGAAFIGAATIIATGYAGRRIAGRRVGIIAAFIVAAAPTSFFYEWELLSETLVMLGAALTLLLAYRFHDQPSLGGAISVGLMCGLLALTHSGQALLLVLLLAPLVLLAHDVSMRVRWAWLAAGTAVAIGVAVPWAAYNTARFQEPVLLSTESGATLAGANCPSTYSGRLLGFGDATCRLAAAIRVGKTNDESILDTGLRRTSLDFIRHHLGQLPVVIAAREGRVFGLFRPGQQMRFDTGRGTPHRYVQIGFFVFWALEVLAVVGIVALRRRKIPLYPILAFVASVVIVVAVSLGVTRFRAAAEVSIALLAAVGIDAVLHRLSRAL